VGICAHQRWRDCEKGDQGRQRSDHPASGNSATRGEGVRRGWKRGEVRGVRGSSSPFLGQRGKGRGAVRRWCSGGGGRHESLVELECRGVAGGEARGCGSAPLRNEGSLSGGKRKRDGHPGKRQCQHGHGEVADWSLGEELTGGARLSVSGRGGERELGHRRRLGRV
jgi:hypothetical protein